MARSTLIMSISTMMMTGHLHLCGSDALKLVNIQRLSGTRWPVDHAIIITKSGVLYYGHCGVVCVCVCVRYHGSIPVSSFSSSPPAPLRMSVCIGGVTTVIVSSVCSRRRHIRCGVDMGHDDSKHANIPKGSALQPVSHCNAMSALSGLPPFTSCSLSLSLIYHHPYHHCPSHMSCRLSNLVIVAIHLRFINFTLKIYQCLFLMIFCDVVASGEKDTSRYKDTPHTQSTRPAVTRNIQRNAPTSVLTTRVVTVRVTEAATPWCLWMKQVSCIVT